LVINLLAQFQVLTKAPGSIPSSPAVLIKWQDDRLNDCY
jgi:hypothetical protein